VAGGRNGCRRLFRECKCGILGGIIGIRTGSLLTGSLIGNGGGGGGGGGCWFGPEGGVLYLRPTGFCRLVVGGR
jgi:hypothetical protein